MEKNSFFKELKVFQMVSVFVSWKKGLVQDKKAMQFLKKSNYITGIELSDTGEDIDEIKENGLEYNLHNPLREYKIGLDDKEFVKYFKKFEKKDLKDYCNNSFPKEIGFHTGYSSMMRKNVTKKEIINNTTKNIDFLEKELNKKILFESTVYSEKFFSKGVRELGFYSTSENFFEKILKKTSSGFLFDISHNFVSGKTKIKRKEYEKNIENYFEDILEKVSKKTFQLHINVPSGNEKGYFDTHNKIVPQEKLSQKILELSKQVFDSCPKTRTITLEINTPHKPLGHAKTLEKQARIVSKKLLK